MNNVLLAIPMLNADNYPLIILIAAITALLALFMIVVTLILIYVNRVRVRAYEQRKIEAELVIVDELNEHILKYDSVNDIPEEELSQVLQKLNSLKNKSKLYAKVLTRTLVGFSLILTGTIVRVINSTYNRLRLREFTLRKLKSKFWFVKVEGLKEVQEMHDGHSLTQVSALTKDKNADVRVSAYAALLQLNSNQKYSFLLHEKDQLTQWHQILLSDAIDKVPLDEIPDFKTYLASENDSVVQLCIKLILYYNQMNAIPKLIFLLNHENEDIRCHVIHALGQLSASEAEKKLIEIYPKEHIRNKSQILLSLGNIMSVGSLQFITDKFLKADHFTLLKSAAAAMVFFPQEIKSLVPFDLTQLDEEQKAVIRHFEEPLNLYGSI